MASQVPRGFPACGRHFQQRDRYPMIAHPALLDVPWSAVEQHLFPTSRPHFSKRRSSGQQCCRQMSGSLSISRSVLPPSAAVRAGMHHRGCALSRVVLGYGDCSIDVSSLPMRVLHHAQEYCRRALSRNDTVHDILPLLQFAASSSLSCLLQQRMQREEALQPPCKI